MSKWRVEYVYDDGFVETHRDVEAPDVLTACDEAQPDRLRVASVVKVSVVPEEAR